MLKIGIFFVHFWWRGSENAVCCLNYPWIQCLQCSMDVGRAPSCRDQVLVIPVMNESRMLSGTHWGLCYPFNLMKWFWWHPFLMLHQAPQFNVCHLIIFLTSQTLGIQWLFIILTKITCNLSAALSLFPRASCHYELFVKGSEPQEARGSCGVHCSHHPSFSERWLSLTDAPEECELYPIKVTCLDPSSDAGTCFEG